jgi:monovalent cation:H+ antiporter-2, CPA2 family
MVLAASGSGAVLVELGLVLLALALLGRGADRVGLSPVPLYLLVGLVLGDSGPFDLDVSSGFIETGAAIGVVLLLFLLGLEYTPVELFSTTRRQLVPCVVDLALNFTPGLVAGLWLGWDPLEAVLLGGVTYVSSSGIVAKLLADLGRTANRETPVILSILVVEDLVMALYLPLLAGLLAGGSVLATTGSVTLALVLVGAIMLVAYHFGPTLSRVVFSRSPEVLLFTVLGLTLLIAGIAEEAQVSAAVGAFLVGIALSGPTAERAQPLLLPVRDLFAAAFFVFFGIEIDLAGLVDVLAPAIALAALTAATKVATGWLAAERAGVGPKGRWRAGTTLIARGEFSIIIAELARSAGVGGDLPALAAAYVLILAVVGPLASRLLDSVQAVRQR